MTAARGPWWAPLRWRIWWRLTGRRFCTWCGRAHDAKAPDRCGIGRPAKRRKARDLSRARDRVQLGRAR